MRDKLIQILRSHPAEWEIADDILAELRCDKCEHWDEACNNNQSAAYDALTKPDFFCSGWEPRERTT